MSSQDTDQADKSFEPTPEKLKQARAKGEVAKSADLSVAASYLGLLVVLIALGSSSILSVGSSLMTFLDSPDRLTHPEFAAVGAVRLRDAIGETIRPTMGWFLVPAAAVPRPAYSDRDGQ